MKKIYIKKQCDSGHGWYPIKRKLLNELGLLDKITQFSYQSKSGKTIYLEEDSDASLFFKTYLNKYFSLDLTYNNMLLCFDIDYKNVNGNSYIRQLERFTNA